MTSFDVAPQCHALGLRAGAILFRDLCISPSPASLREAIDAASQRVHDTFTDRRSIRSHPGLQRIREILKSIGSDPRRLGLLPRAEGGPRELSLGVAPARVA